MSKFHSNVSRRDFMKGLGLGAAGLGAAAATAPVFHDLDEVIIASSGQMKRPWWIKEVDAPTMEVDWSQVERYAEINTLRGSRTKYLAEAGLTDEYNRRKASQSERLQELLVSNAGGYSLRDCAIRDSAGKGFSEGSLEHGRSYLGPQTVKSPEQRGVPRWQGTPEEAAHMLRHAMRLFGCLTIGFIELDPNTTRKLIYSHEPKNTHKIVFEDVDQAYETTGPDAKHVIPNKCRWAIVFADPDSQEFVKRDPARICFQFHYQWSTSIQERTQEFLHALGYQGIGQSPNSNGLGGKVGLGQMSGLGETGRHNRLITPELGNNVGLFMMITDLPLAAGKPIDAGMFKFCRTCMKCAKACNEGQGALSMETEPYWEIKGPWNSAGHRAYFENSVNCRMWAAAPETCTGSASQCIAVCTFSKGTESSIHELVSATTATTSLFNSFFARMDDAFGYGLKDPATFWDFPMPITGIDTTIGMNSY